MRAVNRPLLTRFHASVLPLLLAALVFRVLVPPGFMMIGDPVLRAAMCTTQPGKTETIELPGESGKVHCEQCMAPPLGAPLADVRLAALPPATPSRHTPVVAQISDSFLVRAQSARAPPLA